LNELGLKEINNCAFVMSTVDNIKKLLLVSNYVGYGLPTKKIVDDVIRKRGYLKTADHKRMPISDNILIEELLGS
jgi:large subunit ribosomal protein L7e